MRHRATRSRPFFVTGRNKELFSAVSAPLRARRETVVSGIARSPQKCDDCSHYADPATRAWSRFCRAGS